MNTVDSELSGPELKRKKQLLSYEDYEDSCDDYGDYDSTRYPVRGTSYEVPQRMSTAPRLQQQVDEDELGSAGSLPKSSLAPKIDMLQKKWAHL